MPKTKLMSEQERLKAFIYLLLRDSVNFGAVEKALQEVNAIDARGSRQPSHRV